MNWYVLINGEIKADNLNKKQAFDICDLFHKENPKINSCRILMCRKIKRNGVEMCRKIKRNGVEMYSKMCYNEFCEDGVYYGT
jgi:hypothetical protein